MGEEWFDAMKNGLSSEDDMVTVAFKELWETRQLYKDKYLKQTEALVNKKRDLWTLENVAKWGIKDQQFVSQNIEHLTSDFEFAS